MRMTEIARALHAFGARAGKPRVTIGLDGFVDRIAHRVAGEGGAPFDTMASLGARLIERRERSSSFALSGVIARPGGNMPNTAMTLCALGLETTCIGALGYPEVERAFAPLARSADVLSYAEPGVCLAMEFRDCKAFFSDNGELAGMNWETFLARVGRAKLEDAIGGADALCLVNWGEIEAMQALWQGIAVDILPGLSKKPRHILVDTADVTGRSPGDVRALFETLRALRGHARLALSVNDGELRSLCDALGIPEGEPDGRCRALLGTGAMDALVWHSVRFAKQFSAEGEAVLPTRYAESPVLLTGGGDNFNAGFLLGVLMGLEPTGCLATGNAASSHYVHGGTSASIDDLVREINRSLELWREASA